jgi:pimeloyl-ACP methyl ester carboxylesterase
MARRRLLPPTHTPFASLPVRSITVDGATDRIAVHVAGRLDDRRIPLLCLAGYHRNMTDFAALIGYLHRMAEGDWPVVLVDLRGRGRSSDRRDKRAYSSVHDAHDVAVVASALAIEHAILLGQGYGGQVIMAVAAERPTLNAGAVLIDAGPVSDPRGLVRLRNNLSDLEQSGNEATMRRMARQMLAVDYPGATEPELDALALRTHYVDRGGHFRALFDRRLIDLLSGFEHDDVLVAQWPLFNALGTAPLMMMRTQYTEQLRRETFEEMMHRRRDAQGYIIEGQGSPALLDNSDDVRPIAEFVRTVTQWRRSFASAPA